MFTKFYELKSRTGIFKFKLTLAWRPLEQHVYIFFAILTLTNFELVYLDNQSKYRKRLINVSWITLCSYFAHARRSIPDKFNPTGLVRRRVYPILIKGGKFSYPTMPRFQLYYQLDVDTRSRICDGASRSERWSALSVAIALRELLRFRQSELCQFVKLSLLSVSNGHGTR